LSSEMEQVTPTRQELVRLRRRIALAESLVDIIKKDLEALMRTLFDLVKELQEYRDDMYRNLGDAYDTFTRSELMVGSRAVESVSLAATPMEYNITEEKRVGVIGLEFPKLSLDRVQDPSPRFNLMDTPMELDAASLRIQEGMVNIVGLAEIEASIRVLLDVIAIKNRQLNRLEHRVLPNMGKAVTYIELILEETERQDSIRVRVLQRKRKERSSKS
jgi:V/A-type H+/Na+-transporting ATPase subunit D